MNNEESEKAVESARVFLGKYPELLSCNITPIDYAKLDDMMNKSWSQIMRENAALGLPVYERIQLSELRDTLPVTQEGVLARLKFAKK